VRKATSSVNFYAAGLQLVPIVRRFQQDLIGIIQRKPAGLRGQGNHWNLKERVGSDRGGSTWVYAAALVICLISEHIIYSTSHTISFYL